MKLVFLYGPPAVGKLTVARHLAARTGYKLFHNHLAVDTLLSVFEFGSPAFVELRESIWLSVFEQACRSGLPGLIFTFAPEASVRQEFIEQTRERVTAAGGLVQFVEFTCPRSQLLQRMNDPSRHEHGKLTSARLFEELEAQGVFRSPRLPAPVVCVDTGTVRPAEAAAQIVAALDLERRSP